MFKFFSRPRSIATAIAWGVISAIATFAGILILDFLYSIHTENFGPPHKLSAISLGNGYSIDFEATPAHPFLAEYKQQVLVYANDARSGGLIGRVEIPMNTGGRVRILISVPVDPTRKVVALTDRHFTSIIDLVRLQVQDSHNGITASDWVPIGLLSAESPPLKFIPCVLWQRLATEERESIAPNPANSSACALAAG